MVKNITMASNSSVVALSLLFGLGDRQHTGHCRGYTTWPSRLRGSSVAVLYRTVAVVVQQYSRGNRICGGGLCRVWTAAAARLLGGCVPLLPHTFDRFGRHSLTLLIRADHLNRRPRR